MTRRPSPEARGCTHPHGDHIPHLAPWVCGVCWTKLDSRPVRYGPAPEGTGGPPQIIKWQAEVRKSGEGLTLAVFLRTMAKRYQMRCREPLNDAAAYDFAWSFLHTLGEEFGDPAYDWSHAGARYMADEDMQDWEHGAGRNA